jgi:hypothetical protein
MIIYQHNPLAVHEFILLAAWLVEKEQVEGGKWQVAGGRWQMKDDLLPATFHFRIAH